MNEKVIYPYKSKTPKPNTYKHLSRGARVLLIASLAVWFISLLLPAFYVSRNGAAWGWIILMLMPVAWFIVPAGLAVYANLFYAYAVIRFFSGKKPHISIIIMLLLAALTFTLREVPQGLSGHWSSVYAWGYGALVWGYSLILLAGAAWDKQGSHRLFKFLLPYIIVFIGIACGITALKMHQWQQFNVYERAKYLTPLTAFTLVQPSGIHYVYQKLPNTLPNLDIPLGVDGKIVLNTHDNARAFIELANSYFELPNVFLYQGYKITNAKRFFIVEKSDIQAAYRYQIENKGNNKVRLSLYDIPQGQEIWSSEEELDRDEHFVDKEIPNLFRQPESIEPEKKPMPSKIILTEACTAPAFPSLKSKGLYLGNQVTFFDKEDHQALLCNDDAALIISVKYHYHEPFFLKFYLIQRDGLHYWATYYLPDEMYDDKFKALFHTYPNMVEHIHSVETTTKGLLIKHEFGETLFMREAEN